MLRRSNSSSQIPLPKSDAARRSKSAVRLSGKTGLGSMDRLNVPRCSGVKRSIGTTPLMTSAASKKSSIGKYTTPSLPRKTGSVKKSTLTTPATLFKRSNSNLTPSSYRSRSRSPFKIGSEKEKDWMNEQLAKVRSYLQCHRHCPEEIAGVKPPITIDTFVFIINLLFKEINPSLTVQTSNYKTVVVDTLKMLQYPGNFKNSLLQTVNTKHAWRDVLCMFSWLVDLIITINSVPIQTIPDDLKRKKIECITDFITKRYLAYNGTGDQEEIDKECGEAFAKILNIDENEIQQLETRVTALHKGKEEQQKKLHDKQTRNEKLKASLDEMQHDIDIYYANKKEKEDDTKYAMDALKARHERLQSAIKNKKERVAKLAGIVDKQSYTVADKHRIIGHIDQMKHTISLKKETIIEKKALKHTSDLKFAEAKKELETQIYRFNNRVMKLAAVEPKLKILYLKEKDFSSKEFQDDLEELSKNYNIFKNKFAQEITEINAHVSNMKSKIAATKQQKKVVQETIKKLNETINTIEKKIEKLDKEMELMSKQRQDNRNIFKQKVAEMKETETALIKSQQELAELEETRSKKASDMEIRKQRSLEFFRNLHNLIVGNLEEMNNVRTEIFEILTNCLTKVEKTEGQILEDLCHLDDLQENH